MQHPDDKLPVTQAVTRRLQDMIRSGAFARDARLPSQRVLARELGVSRASLREALLTLETLGLLRTLPARGTFVTGGQLRPQTAIWRYDHAYPIRDVFETRILLESEMCRLAATAIAPEALARLEAAAETFRSAWDSDDLVRHVEADLEFHGLIAEASGNAVLQDLYRSVRDPITETQRVPIPNTAPARMDASIAEHRDILAALRARAASDAQAAMARHIANTAACAGVVLS